MAKAIVGEISEGAECIGSLVVVSETEPANDDWREPKSKVRASKGPKWSDTLRSADLAELMKQFAE